MKTVRMNSRFLSLVVAMSLGVSVPVIAAEFTDSVPLPLVKALIMGPTGDEASLHSGIPDSFPDVAIPANFSVLGAVEHSSNSRVILQTSSTREEAVAALSDALLSAGLVDFQPMAGVTGFTPSNTMMSPRIFCRDDVGYMTVMFTEHAGLNQVSLGTSRAMFDSGASSCAELMQPQGPAEGRPGAFLVSNLVQHMPTMALPGSATSSPQPFLGFSSGGSSGSGHYETSSEFGSNMSIPQLYQHFAGQIGSQGWALDSEGTGQISATGNWIKIPDADTYLHGAFNIIQNSESNFTIRFRLTKLNVEQ